MSSKDKIKDKLVLESSRAMETLHEIQEAIGTLPLPDRFRLYKDMLGISSATLQNWEQGRRQPGGAARVLLKMAERHPGIILEAAA